MTSQRHTLSTRVGRVDDDLLLDAARECVLDVGVRRTTLSSVARAAGVSRMTLYRRFPDVRSLLAALMTREFGSLLAKVDRAVRPSATARERVVAIAVDGVRGLAVNKLMRTVLERDAEVVLPYLVTRIGAVQRIAEQFLREHIVAGHRDGSIRRADPAAQARVIFLVAQSFVYSMRPATADLERATLIGELTHLLDATLRPERSQP
jgi:AcrR family transcriptional regulator